MGVLDQAIDTAIKFKPYTDGEVAELLGRTKDLAKDGAFEKFKTSEKFDGTNQHPKWLTTAEI